MIYEKQNNKIVKFQNGYYYTAMYVVTKDEKECSSKRPALLEFMYSRYLLKTSHFGCISDILFPFSRRTHRVRTAKMSLYIKNPSRNSSFRRFREYISYLIIIYTKMKFKARNIKFYVCIILLKILCY